MPSAGFGGVQGEDNTGCPGGSNPTLAETTIESRRMALPSVAPASSKGQRNTVAKTYVATGLSLPILATGDGLPQGPAVAVSVGHAESTTKAAVLGGATVIAGNVDVTASNTNTFTTANLSLVLDPKNVGLGVGTVTANQAGANASAVSQTNGVHVQAVNNTTSTTQASAMVINKIDDSGTLSSKIAAFTTVSPTVVNPNPNTADLGAGVTYVSSTNTAEAYLDTTAVVKSAGNILVNAQAQHDVRISAAGSAGDAKRAIGGAVEIAGFTNTADAHIAGGAWADAKENLAVTSSATIPNPASYLRAGFDFSNLTATAPPDPAPNPPEDSNKSTFSSIAGKAKDGFNDYFIKYIGIGLKAVQDGITPLISYVGGDAGVANKVTTSAIESSASATGTSANPITGAQVLAGGASILTVTNQATAYIGNAALVNQNASYQSASQSVTVAATGYFYTLDLAAMASLISLAGGSSGNTANGNSLGGFFNEMDFTNAALAYIDHGALVSASGGAGNPTPSANNVTVQANTSTYVVAVTQTGGKAPDRTASGSFGYVNFHDNTIAYIADKAKVNADNAISVSALHDLSVTNVSGQVNYGGPDSDGAAVSLTSITDTTKAFIGNDKDVNLASSGTVTAGGAVSVHASSQQGVYSIGFGFVATQNPSNPPSSGSSGSGTDQSLPELFATDAVGALKQNSGIGISGKAAVNLITNDTEAYVSNNVNVTAGGALSVTADDTALIVAATGSFALSLTDTGGGFAGAYAQNTLNQTTRAFTQNCTLSAGGALTVSATTTDRLYAISAGAAGAKSDSTKNVVGSANLNQVTANTEATLGSSTTVSTSDSVKVTATGSIDTTSVPGAITIASGKGLGASGDVGIYKNTVKASVGSGARITTTKDAVITAQGIETVLSVAGSLAVASQSLGVAGSATSQTFTNDVQAFIAGQAKVQAGGTVAVGADDKTGLLLVGGGAGLLSQTDVGAGAANSNITRTVKAFIGSGADVEANGAGAGVGGKGVVVNATAEDTVLAIAGGIGASRGPRALAASAVVNTLSSDVEAYIDTNAKVNTTTPNADLGQAVAVHAQHDRDVTVVAGSFAVSRSASGGAAFDQEQVNQNTVKAFIASSATVKAQQDVNVSATSNDRLLSVPVSLAGALTGVDIAGSAANVNITSDTEAYIDSSAKVTSQLGNVVVAANHSETLKAGAGQLGYGGGASIGASVVRISETDTTIARIGSSAQVTAGGAIQVSAHGTENLLAVAVGASLSDAVGLAGSVAVVILNNTTKAYADTGATLTAGGNVLVTSVDDTTTQLNTGAVAFGGSGAGVGGSVSYAEVNKTTQTYLGQNTHVNAGSQSSLPLTVLSASLANGNPFNTESTQGVIVQATSSEHLTSSAAAGGGGFYGGVGGAVTIEIVKANTTADIGNGAKVNDQATSSANQSVHVTAADDLTSTVLDGGIGVGAGGVAGSVDVGIVQNKTTAFIGDSAQVSATKDVDVYALSSKKISSTAAAGSAGGLGLGGSVIDYAIGSSIDQSLLLGGKVAAYADGQTKTSDMSTLLASSATSGGTTASIGSATVSAGGNLTVHAEEGLTLAMTVGTAVLGATGAFGGSVAVANIGEQTSALIGQGATLSAGAAGSLNVTAQFTENASGKAYAGQAGGIVGLGAQVVLLNDTSITTASVGSRSDILTAGNFSVTAGTSRTLNGQSIGGTLATYAAGASVARVKGAGSTSASIAGNVKVGTDTGANVGNVLVYAGDATSASAQAQALAAGIGAGAGNLAEAQVYPAVSSFIDYPAQVLAHGALTIDAIVTSNPTAQADGITAGGIAIGVSLATVTAQPTVFAGVKDPPASGATGTSSIQVAGDGHDLTVEASANGSAKATANASGGGALSGNGSQTDVTVQPSVTALLGSGTDVQVAHNLVVVADSALGAKADAEGLSVGGFTVGISKATVDANPTLSASIGGGKVSAGNDLTVESFLNYLRPQSPTTTAYTATANTSVGALVGGNGSVATTNVSASTAANVKSGGQVSAGHDVNVLAWSSVAPSATSAGNAYGALAGGQNTATVNVTKDWTRPTVSGQVQAGNNFTVQADARIPLTATTTSGSGGLANLAYTDSEATLTDVTTIAELSGANVTVGQVVTASAGTHLPVTVSSTMNASQGFGTTQGTAKVTFGKSDTEVLLDGTTPKVAALGITLTASQDGTIATTASVTTSAFQSDVEATSSIDMANFKALVTVGTGAAVNSTYTLSISALQTNLKADAEEIIHNGGLISTNSESLHNAASLTTKILFQTGSSINTPALYLSEVSLPTLITNSHTLAYPAPGYGIQNDQLCVAQLTEDTGTVTDGTITVQGNRTVTVSIAADGTVTKSPNAPGVRVYTTHVVIDPILNNSTGLFHETTGSVKERVTALGSGKTILDPSMDRVSIENFSNRQLFINGIDPVNHGGNSQSGFDLKEISAVTGAYTVPSLPFGPLDPSKVPVISVINHGQGTVWLGGFIGSPQSNVTINNQGGNILRNGGTVQGTSVTLRSETGYVGTNATPLVVQVTPIEYTTSTVSNPNPVLTRIPGSLNVYALQSVVDTLGAPIASSGVYNVRGVLFMPYALTPTAGVALKNVQLLNNAPVSGSQLSYIRSGFSATINWGDNTTTTLNNLQSTNNLDPYNIAAIAGGHTYVKGGIYTLSVTVTGAFNIGGSAISLPTVTFSQPVDVAWPITAFGHIVTPGKNTPFTGSVADFSNGDPNASASQFSATIDWGDGSVSGGTITRGGTGFLVNGSHTYTSMKTYNGKVTIHGPEDYARAQIGFTANVGDSLLSPDVVMTGSAQRDVSFTGTVVTFTDSDPTTSASSYSAVINWGDGSPTSTGTVTGSAGHFVVKGTHTFTQVGQVTVSVTITDAAHTQLTTTNTFLVRSSLGPVVGTDVALPRNTFSVVQVATFTDADLTRTSSAYQTQIDWGDGTPLDSGFVGGGNGSFAVTAAHTYVLPGTFIIRTTVSDGDPSPPTGQITATVADAPIIAVPGPQLLAGQNVPFTGVVANFDIFDYSVTTSDFTAAIDWADGTTSAGVIGLAPGGPFTVTGTHSYPSTGPHPITVSIAHIIGGRTGSTATTGDVVTVTPGPITAQGTTIVTNEGATFSGTVATFTSADPQAAASRFRAVINWGDGSPNTQGTVTGTGTSGFTVAGTHVYPSDGSYTVGVTFTDTQGGTQNVWVPVASLPNATAAGAAVTGSDGRIYVLGGNAYGGFGPPYSNQVKAYTPSTNSWTSAPSLPNPLTNLAAVPGPDGLLYAIGGRSFDPVTAGAPTASVYTYRPGDAQWSSTTPSLPVALADPAATVGKDGRIYVIGGTQQVNFQLVTSAAVYAYTPGSGSWATTLPPLPAARSSAAAVTGLDGTLYVIGGLDSSYKLTNTVFALRPGASAWIMMPSLPLPLWGLQALVGPDGTVYTLGGLDADHFSVPAVFTLAPGATHWATVGSLTAPHGNGMAVSAGGTFYVLGGDGGGSDSGPINTVEALRLFSPSPATATTAVTVREVPLTVQKTALDTFPQGYYGITPGAATPLGFPLVWFTDANPTRQAGDFTATVQWGDGQSSSASLVEVGQGQFGVEESHTFTATGFQEGTVSVQESGANAQTVTSRAALPMALQGMASATGADGRIYAIGGATALGPTNRVFVYTPATDSWQAAAFLPETLLNAAATAGPDGRIYVFGGVNFQGQKVASTFIYDPASNSWSRGNDMPEGRSDLAVALGPHGKMYVIGGFDNSFRTSASVFVYNPAANTWTLAPSLPAGLRDLEAAAGPDGKIYAIGGIDAGTNVSNRVYAYRPGDQAWTKGQALPAPVAKGAAILGLDGTLFVLGGITDFGSFNTTVYAHSANSSPLSAWAAVDTLPAAQWYLGVGGGHDGFLYAYGGLNGSTAMTAATVAITDRLLAGITFYVVPANPSVPNEDAFTATQNTAFTGNVLANDQLLPPDGNPLHDSRAVLISKPYHGVVQFQADGTFTYTPYDGNYLPDSFQYAITNGPITSNSAKVVIDFVRVALPDQTLIASAGFDQVAVAGTTVAFNDLLTHYGNFPFSTIANPTWDFGDPSSGAVNTSSGYHTVTHVYNTPGTYTVTLRFVDPFNSSGHPFGSAAVQVTVLPQGSTAPTGTVVPSLFQLQEAISASQQGAFLSAILGGIGAPTPVILDVTPASMPDVFQALLNPTSDSRDVYQVPVVLNLTGGSYTDVIANLAPSVNLTVIGNGSTVIVGHSPALTVGPGSTLTLDGVTLQTPTDAPTILVNGGTLILRHSVVEESTGFAAAAIEVTSGTVDLGTAADPGGNTFEINGAGEFIHNTSGNAISALGNTFSVNGVALTSGYEIEDAITHALDAGGSGLVTFSSGDYFVTPASGSIQRAIDAAPDGSVLHVEAGTYFAYDTHRRPLTLMFAGNSRLLPVARAGTAYSVREGQGITLDATESLTADLPVTYTWTVNGHTFDPQSSPKLVLGWEDLQAAGITDGPATFTVQVEVNDGLGDIDDSPAVALDLLNTPPTAFLVNSGTVETQTPSDVSFTQVGEPSDLDDSTGLRSNMALDPADLATSYAAAAPLGSRAFTFASPGDHVVYGRIFDKDGGSSDYATIVHVLANLNTTPGLPDGYANTGGPSSPKGHLPGLIITGADVGAVFTGPEVRVTDAATGAERFRFLAFRPSYHGGVRVALGDVNGDGMSDFIVGAGNGLGGLVRVFDGKTGTQLAGPLGRFKPFKGFQGGVYVAGGDINGDGHADVMVTEGEGGRPRVRVFSGADGSLLDDFLAYRRGSRGGVRVAAGDVNGDGHADIIVTPAGKGARQLKVFSGLTETVLCSWTPFKKPVAGGLFAATGDVFGTGRTDLVVGQGQGGASQVVMLNGATGESLGSFTPFAGGFSGGVRVGLADVNHDGKPDILTSAGPNNVRNLPEVGSKVRAFDGLTHESLDRFFAHPLDFLGGVFVGGS
jgi:N-acetylneuraminic acid mutarotase